MIKLKHLHSSVLVNDLGAHASLDFILIWGVAWKEGLEMGYSYPNAALAYTI